MVILPCSLCCNKCECGECQSVVADWTIDTASGVTYSGTTAGFSCLTTTSYDEEFRRVSNTEYAIVNGVNVADLNKPEGDGSNIVASVTCRCGPIYSLERGEWLVDVSLSISTRIPAPGSGSTSQPVSGFCNWSGIVKKCEQSGFPVIKRDDLTLVSQSGSLGLTGCADFDFQLRTVP